jgi:hypothetical protein
MPKNITITNIDNFNINDKNNMNKEPPRKLIKMIHEQLYDQYGIDQNKVFERTGLLKTIPSNWIPEILILNINSCITPINHKQINLQDRSIVLGFETEEMCKKFSGDPDNHILGEFNMNMNKTINNFLSSKNEEPKKYNRIIVIETVIDSKQMTLSY